MINHSREMVKMKKLDFIKKKKKHKFDSILNYEIIKSMIKMNKVITTSLIL